MVHIISQRTFLMFSFQIFRVHHDIWQPATFNSVIFLYSIIAYSVILSCQHFPIFSNNNLCIYTQTYSIR
jgi:hypothetical protein